MRQFLLIALTLGATTAIAGIADGKPNNQPDGFTTGIKAYATGLSGWETHAILSAGDRVPETGNGSAVPLCFTKRRPAGAEPDRPAGHR